MCQELLMFVFVFGCKLSPFRLRDSDFGITPVDDITIGITCAAFCFHIAHISFTTSWYLLLLLLLLFCSCCCGGGNDELIYILLGLTL
jgi:hypothetical protein